jgi:hypothetical protein
METEKYSGDIVPLGNHPKTKNRTSVTNKTLKDSIKRISKTDQWEKMIDTWAGCRTITENLVNYLGNVVPSHESEEPLLDTCLRAGITYWEHCLVADRPVRETFFKGYVRGILKYLPETLEWQVAAEETTGKVIAWNPLEETFDRWRSRIEELPQVRKRQRHVDTTHVHIAPADYRFLVLVRYLVVNPASITPYMPYIDEMVSRYG